MSNALSLAEPLFRGYHPLPRRRCFSPTPSSSSSHNLPTHGVVLLHVPLHAPLQQWFPVGDDTMDLVWAGHAVNRWMIPEAALEFLWYDVDRDFQAITMIMHDEAAQHSVSRTE
uniref:Uncharacterized protein n=1 Tax=Oryza glumipatula TaxID=40148 RepID=A0A0D9Y4R7_9ORYZ